MESRSWSRDTSHEAFERRVQALRALGPERRLAAGLALCDEVREGLVAALKARRPELTDQAVRREIARRLLGEALFQRAFNESGAA